MIPPPHRIHLLFLTFSVLGMGALSPQPARARQTATANPRVKAVQPAMPDPAIALVRKLKGSAEVDPYLPGWPVVKVSFYSVRLKDEDLAVLKKTPKLRSLNLIYTRVTNRAMQYLRHVPELEELYLTDTQVYNPAMPIVAKLTKLRVLHLNSWVTDQGFAELKGLKELRELYLFSGCTDTALAQVKRYRTLKKLILQGGTFTDKGLEHLRGMPALEHLDASSSPITPAGLAYLKDLPRLRELRLGGGSGKFLPVVRALPSLEVLTLMRPTGDGEAELDHLRALKHLRSLSLTGLPISDRNLPLIAELKNLESLSILGSGITDAGLVKLQGLPKLRNLTLLRSRVTDAGLEKLRKAMPGLYAEHLR